MKVPDKETLADLLERGVTEVIDQKHLELKIRRGKPLRIKYGIDPTGHHIHLGHAVPLQKLREWQRLGHTAVVVIGDYTAQVGDPSGRDKQRNMLTKEMVDRFASTYVDQIGKILDLKQTEIRYNSKWFERFTAADFLQLTREASVQQLLAHETFRERLKKDAPLSLLELLYPLLQGYDSVAVEADVELGGIDQKFNLLMGRTIQASHDQEPQDIMMMPYLVGTDGKKKMSKSEDNFIALEDSATEMYGKVMSLPDKVLPEYFTLTTNIPAARIIEIQKALKKKDTNPRDLKADLARRIVERFYGAHAASDAEFEFTKVFRNKQQPSEMPTLHLSAGKHPLINILVGHQLAASRSAARRLVEQGGVKYNKQPITDWEAHIEAQEGAVLQVGKRRFVKITLSPE